MHPATTLHKCFKFDISFTDYGVVAENSTSVICPKFLRAPCRKNCVGAENDCHLLEWSRHPLPLCKLSSGKIEQRAPAVGAKIWCLYFFCLFLFLVTLRGQRAVRSRDIFWASTVSRFMGRLSRWFHLFSGRQERMPISFARWRHNFREIMLENCENSRNRRKSLCAPLRMTSCWLLCTGATVVVHPYCGFSLRRQMAPQQTVKFRNARFRQFRSFWGRIASPIMDGFECSFRHRLED